VRDVGQLSGAEAILISSPEEITVKMKKAVVRNYKSVENSGEFSVDQITCLVGKNEAGKSAILDALYKLNPVEQNRGEFRNLSFLGGESSGTFPGMNGSKNRPSVLLGLWKGQIAARQRLNLALTHS
jgi:hypothetical protein